MKGEEKMEGQRRKAKTETELYKQGRKVEMNKKRKKKKEEKLDWASVRT